MRKKKKPSSSSQPNSFVKTPSIGNERFLSTQPPEISAQKVQAQVDELKRQHQLFASIFNTKNGREVIEELERVAFFKNSTFNIDGSGLRMAYNEGQRMLLNHIKNLSDPHMFGMLREQILSQNTGKE